MSVVRLFGKNGDAEIEFYPSGDPDQWQIAVPPSPDGVYYLELWAEDEAGNVGYYTTVKTEGVLVPAIISAVMEPNPALVGVPVFISVAAADLVAVPAPEEFESGEITSGEV